MVKIRGFFKDIKGPNNVIKLRRQKIQAASSRPITRDPINELAKKIHPDKVFLTIESVENTTPTSKTYRFIKSKNNRKNIPDIPIFQAGQYISFKFQIGNSWVTRPFSISSAPYEVLGKEPFIEVSIRKKEKGFVTEYI